MRRWGLLIFFQKYQFPWFQLKDFWILWISKILIHSSPSWIEGFRGMSNFLGNSEQSLFTGDCISYQNKLNILPISKLRSEKSLQNVNSYLLSYKTFSDSIK